MTDFTLNLQIEEDVMLGVKNKSFRTRNNAEYVMSPSDAVDLESPLV